MRLSIAGIIIGLESAWPLRALDSLSDQERTQEDRLQSFIYRGSRSPDIVVKVRLVKKLPDRIGWAKVFDAHTIEDKAPNWTLWRKGKRYVFFSSIAGRHQHIISNVAMDRVQACLVMDGRAQSGCWDLSELVYYFLEVYLLQYLARTGKGFFLHASAVVDRAKGYVFAGRSGCGKTTMSRLWFSSKCGQVINDERVIVLMRKGGFWVYRTPWFGELGECLDASAPAVPISAIFFLSHGKEHRLRRLDNDRAVRHALYSVVLWPFWDPQEYSRVCDLADRFSVQVPGYQFAFLKDGSVVEVVRSVLGRRSE